MTFPTIRVVFVERAHGSQISVLCARCGRQVGYCDKHGCRPYRQRFLAEIDERERAIARLTEDVRLLREALRLVDAAPAA